MILDSFTERIVWILSELHGQDPRSEFRKDQIRNLVISTFPEIDDPAIIHGVTEELFLAIYPDNEK